MPTAPGTASRCRHGGVYARPKQEAQAMLEHGKGPKDGWVRRYFRWQRGRLRWVHNHPRSAGSRNPRRPSDGQLSFGFA
jgi:hypothetical protein